MKKLLTILFLITFLMSGNRSFAQFVRPTGIVTIPTPTFWRNPADSSITIYQGTVNLYNTFLMKWDSVKVKGYFTNYKILQYRKLNNHDSLSTLDERKYQSLTDTVTWGLGLSQLGHVTKVDTSSASILSRQRALKEYALIVHNQSISTIIGLLDSLNNHYTKAQSDALFVPKTLTITATAPITIAGTTSANLSANRTIAIIPSTPSVAGSMSAADKTKLDGIATGATANTGTVTSVSGGTGITGGTITTSGTLAIDTTIVAKKTTVASMYQTLIPKSTGFLTWNGSTWVWDANTYTSAYLLNDTWTKVYDYAGNLQNMWKVSKDNILTPGFRLGIDKLYFVADAGKVNIADMPNLNSAANDTLQYGFNIGNVSMLKMRGIADGSGGLSDTTLVLGGKLKWPGNPTNGYYLKVMPNGIIKPQPITATYQGTWNAATNTPTLADGTGTAGFWYRTVVKGVWGADSARVGSDIYYSGTVWQVIPNATFSVNVATKTVGGIVKLDSTSIKYNGSGQIYTKTDYVENATHSGDATGATALTLATVNSNVGTYTKVTINGKGLATAGTAATTTDIADSSNKRYVTDANITLLGNTSGTNSGDNATNTQYSGLVTNATHSGDATGATALTLATVNSNVGTYNGITVNAKGLVTGATSGNYATGGGTATGSNTGDNAVNSLYSGLVTNATHSGDATGSVALTLATVNSNVGTYNNITINGKGLATAGANVNYKLYGDTLTNPGYFTNYKASMGLGFHLINDQWLTALDYAGNVFNLIKVSKDNLVTVPNLALNSLYFVRNSGVNTIADLPVNVDATTGDYHGFKMNIGGVQALRIAGKWTGTAIDTIKVTAPVFEMTTGAAINKIAMSEDSRGKIKWSDTKYLFSLVANRILYASATNEMSQLPLGTEGQMMRSGGTGTPIWSTPTWPNSATSGKVLIGDGTNVVLSTPTFPNASATINKVIKSDGTNWVASTETYAIPGTSGYVMVSNGTNWTSSAKNLEWDKWAQWDGGATGLTATTGRTSLGGSTIGQAMFTLTNPSTISFLQLNADNSVTAKNAADFRTAIGAGTSSTVGTVTSVAVLTIGTTGTDLNSSVATGTTTPVITLNVPSAGTASVTAGTISKAEYDTFNGKQAPLVNTTNIKSINGTTLLGSGDLSTTQNTVSGTAGGLAAQYIDWNSTSGGSSIANKPTIPTVNDATLTAAVSGSGLSISATPTFTANASANKTITITSNATATNTASTIVLRDGSGNVSLTGTFCTSDSTLKRNIRKLSSTDLYNASKIDFRKFLFRKDTTGHLHFGVLAQDVEKLIPEVVNTNQEGKKEVNYTEMLILIVAQQKEAIRELGKRIEKLENKNRWEAGQVDFSLVQNKDLCPKCKKGHLKPTGITFSTHPSTDAYACDNCNYTTEK